MASIAGHPGRANEDFAGAVPMAAVLVDGAGGFADADAVCRHGVAWYASILGGTLLHLLSFAQDRSLPELLAEAIEQVTESHRGTCDVADPISPSAAVAVLRRSGDRLDHLVLGDAVVVLDKTADLPLVVTDPRETTVVNSYLPALAAAGEGSDEYRRILRDLRANRNRPGGFWVAKDDPRAAAQAITGSCPLAELTGALLLSNGASRFVDRFGLTDWSGLLALLASSGPDEVIRRVRQAEAEHAVRSDDATLVHCTSGPR